MKVVLTTHLRSSDRANRKQLAKARIDIVAAGQRFKDRSGVTEFLLDVELGVGIVRVFEVTVAIDDFVTLDNVLHRRNLGLRRTGGSGRSGGIPGSGILWIAEGSRTNERKQHGSKQTRTCSRK